MEIKKIKFNDLYNSLPTSWEELKYKHFKKIIQIPMKDETVIPLDDLLGVHNPTIFVENIVANVENTLSILSILLDVPVEVLRNLEQRLYLLMVNKIAFVYTDPDIKKYKSLIDWKDIESVTTNDYITIITLVQDPMKNMGTIIQTFSKNGFSNEEIDELNILEVHSGFFLLAERLKKSTTSQIRKEQMRLMKLSGKEIVMNMRFWKRRKG